MAGIAENEYAADLEMLCDAVMHAVQCHPVHFSNMPVDQQLDVSAKIVEGDICAIIEFGRRPIRRCTSRDLTGSTSAKAFSPRFTTRSRSNPPAIFALITS